MSNHGDLVAQLVATGRPSTHDYVRAQCPFCQERVGVTDTKLSFAFHVPSGYWRCLRCQIRGRDQQASSGITVGVQAGLAQQKTHDDECRRPPDGFYRLDAPPGSTSDLAQPARDFLLRRGVGPSAWARYQIGVSLAGRFCGRVIVPLLTGDGAWEGYIARSWKKRAKVPYLYPRGMNRGEMLFNGPALQEPTFEPVFVCEGCWDAIAFGDDGVAVLGMPSTEQIEAIALSRRPVVLCLDRDVYWKVALPLRDRLRLCARYLGRHHFSCGAVALPAGCDPDEVDIAAVRKAGYTSLTV